MRLLRVSQDDNLLNLPIVPLHCFLVSHLLHSQVTMSFYSHFPYLLTFKLNFSNLQLRK